MPRDDKDRGARRPRNASGSRRLPAWLNRRLRCPTCLLHLDPSTAPPNGHAWGVTFGETAVRRFFRRNPTSGRTTALMEPGGFKCQRGHSLPPELFTIGVLPIGLLGVSQSMKTHYIAAVSYQLAYQEELLVLPGRRSLTFTSTEESHERLRHHLIEPLFDNREVLDSTMRELDPRGEEPVRDPIVFEAEALRAIPRAPRRSRTYVSLYDAPGEMFLSQRNQRIYAPYLADPAGVLLFLDVASIPDVRRKLEGDMQLPDGRTIMEPYIVTAAARNMRTYSVGGRRPEIPVSVVVSRADLLEQSDAFKEFHRELGGEPLLDDGANAAAREFVDRYAPKIAIDATREFGDRVRYFFASATGCSPVGDRFPDVTPWGCLGPLVWVLEQDGFLPR